jgi:uncharacterized membrane protein YhdT
MSVFPSSDLIILQTQRLVVIIFICRCFELDGICQREQDRNTIAQKKKEASRSLSSTIGGTSLVCIYMSLDTSQLSVLPNWFVQSNMTVIQNVFLERHLKVTALILFNVTATLFCLQCKLTFTAANKPFPNACVVPHWYNTIELLWSQLHYFIFNYICHRFQLL